MTRFHTRLPHLQVAVYVPGRTFAVVHGFHGGMSHARQVTATEHPRFTGLHGVRVHLRQTPAVHLQWLQGLGYYKMGYVTIRSTNLTGILYTVFFSGRLGDLLSMREPCPLQKMATHILNVFLSF